MKNKWSVTSLIFLCFVFSISGLNVLKDNQTFSEFENRPLKQFPELTLKRFVDGSFTAEFEEYVNDQFLGKTFWTGLKAKSEQAILKQENNNVYFGQNDYLFEKSKKPSEQLQKNINTINEFQNNHPMMPVTFLLAPNSIDLYPEKLPAFAKKGIHEDVVSIATDNLVSTVHFVDPLKSLQEVKNTQIYFRTDHHWTATGAFHSYQTLMRSLGLTPFHQDDFSVETVSTNFSGTFYARANDHFIQPDTIEKFTPKKSIQYEVQFEDGKATESLYDESFLNKRDQYSYFLGGNHAKTVITSSINNGQKLLLIKDSYAHIFAPFLANHFEEIHMIDLRYFHASIEKYIKEKNITESLILYNTSNFAEDSSLVYLKY